MNQGDKIRPEWIPSAYSGENKAAKATGTGKTKNAPLVKAKGIYGRKGKGNILNG